MRTYAKTEYQIINLRMSIFQDRSADNIMPVALQQGDTSTQFET